jgi:hypothetical protein
LKQQIAQVQQRAALAVNRELIGLYWQIGHDILQRQQQQGWGAKVIDRLAHDLRPGVSANEGVLAPQPEIHARVRRRLAGRRICAHSIGPSGAAGSSPRRRLRAAFCSSDNPDFALSQVSTAS